MAMEEIVANEGRKADLMPREMGGSHSTSELFEVDVPRSCGRRCGRFVPLPMKPLDVWNVKTGVMLMPSEILRRSRDMKRGRNHRGG